MKSTIAKEELLIATNFKLGKRSVYFNSSCELYDSEMIHKKTTSK